jgi:hypothetical protein
MTVAVPLYPLLMLTPSLSRLVSLALPAPQLQLGKGDGLIKIFKRDLLVARIS